MSWGVVTADADKDSLLGRLIDEMAIPDYIVDGRAEAEAQLAAAKPAAKALLEANVLGLPGSIFRVGINGHSNDQHVKVEGISHEMLNITVYELAQVEHSIGAGSGPAEPSEPSEPAAES